MHFSSIHRDIHDPTVHATAVMSFNNILGNNKCHLRTSQASWSLQDLGLLRECGADTAECLRVRAKWLADLK
jgi:hypothetical protein